MTWTCKPFRTHSIQESRQSVKVAQAQAHAHAHALSSSCTLCLPSPWWLRSMAKTKIKQVFFFLFLFSFLFIFFLSKCHSLTLPLSLSGPFGLLLVARGHWIKHSRKRRPEQNRRAPLLLCSHCKLSGRWQDCRGQIKPHKHSRAAVVVD